MRRHALRLAAAGLVRSPGGPHSASRCSPLATALLGAMLLFVGNSLRTMTASAVRSVPLDWQGPVASQAQAVPGRCRRRAAARSPASVAGGDRPVRAARALAPAGRDSHRARGRCSPCRRGYLAHLRTFRLLRGTLRAGEVVLDQQLAATLQARIGDTVTLDAERAREAPRATA